MTQNPTRLPAYGLFAGVLAAAGLPLYIHAPKFYVDSYGVSLAALGAVLFVLRLLDVVQDPALGWVSARLRNRRAVAVAIGGGVLGLSMLGLFAFAPPIAPVLWFALMMTGVFSAFSFLTITFYAQGVAKAGSLSGGHVQLARWREAGALIGICIAAIAPVVLGSFAVFAVGFVVLTVLGVWAMRSEWTATQVEEIGPLRDVVQDQLARRLLLIALVNALPVAVTSTLFLFFVESRLNSSDRAGPLLLIFFLSAAVAAPIWGGLAARHGTGRMLLIAMGLAIASFGWALTLVAGDIWAFTFICIVSGAAVGADMTLLPALFASRMAQVAPTGEAGFGLWSFVSKLSLAFAAIALFPILEGAGFQSGAENDADALWMLSLLYAGLPCVLKLVSIWLLSRTDLSDLERRA